MAADGGGSAPSASLALPCAYSPAPRRQYLAVCARDGRLRIWDADGGGSGGKPRQEYAPSARLSAACSCVAWGPCRTSKEGPQRKKRKSEAGQAVEQSDLLALGTAAGTVLIYSTVKGDLHCTLDGGHSGGVNSIQWHPEDSLLYSGSDDTHIVEWDLQTGKTRCKWKADRAAVTSLSVSPDGKFLLSAGMTIKMWDLETKEMYRKFTGHATTITTLCFATNRPPDSNGLYFVSGAAHDRLLSVWQVRSDGKDKNAVVSFTLTDEPQHIDLQTSNSKDEAVRLAVVCKDGQLHLFEHFLNGPGKKPLSPVCSVQVSSVGGKGEGDVPVPVPLLATTLCADKQNLILAYGNHLQPVIEKMPINTTERHVCLIRDLHTTLSLSVDAAVSKVKTPIVNEQKSKVLIPGLPGHKAPIRANSSQPEKRKQGSSLSVSGGKGGDKGASSSLQTDSFAVLLVQGLESKDSQILNVIQWLKAVLTQHTSYLSSLPDLVSQLGLLYHMIETRVKLYHQLTRLHGKLYLLMTQVLKQDPFFLFYLSVISALLHSFLIGCRGHLPVSQQN
uniref:WD repeat domain 43 n=1 Tax=Astyanax mexicanus TaxID=7994 RepID=A0A8B9KPR2_ASTMX